MPFMNSNETGASPLRLLILVCGEILAVSSVYFIKSSTLEPVLLASYRLLTASVILFPLFLRELKNAAEPYTPKELLLPCIPGILLSLHFITWITGARMIPSAHSTLIVNLTPAATPFVLLLLTGERLRRQEILGSLFVISGSFFLVHNDLNLDKTYFRGDLICLFSMVTLATYLVFSKRFMKGLWTYLFPLYLAGGIFCFLFSFTRTNPFQTALSGGDLIAVLGLGILCTIGGHSIMNWAMKKMRGQLVSLFNTTQFLYAGLMGFLVFGEVPRASFLIACAIIVTGLVISVLTPGGPRKEVSP